jgi:hypothetical protein
MKNININNKGEEPINPTWVTKNGEKSHRALKSGEKTDYEHHLGGLTKRLRLGEGQKLIVQMFKISTNESR